jgi:hypothetical protein
MPPGTRRPSVHEGPSDLVARSLATLRGGEADQSALASGLSFLVTRPQFAIRLTAPEAMRTAFIY